MKPLPLFSTWLSDSWKLFWMHRLALGTITIWFVILALGNLAIAFLESQFPGFAFFGWPLRIALAVLQFWTVIRALRTTLSLDKTGTSNLSDDASFSWQLFFPLFWIALIQTLIVVGGFFLLILPGIYLAVALNFAPFFALEEGKRGLESLSASLAIVRGRWWPIFGRSVFSGLIMMAFSFGITIVALLAISAIAGPQKLMYAAAAAQSDPLIAAIFDVITGITLWLLLPLMLAFQVRLWRDAKK